jgi:hypothetical protein
MVGYLNTILMKNEKRPAKIGRDARTGRFIPFKEAERRPKTTVIEKVKRG